WTSRHRAVPRGGKPHHRRRACRRDERRCQREASLVDVSLPGIGGKVSAVRSVAGRRGVLEVSGIVALYLVNELSRGLAGGGEADARRHAADVVSAERHLHVFVESSVQSAARHVAGLPTLLGYAYLSLHLLGTAAVLVWVYRRHRHVYARLRNTLV